VAVTTANITASTTAVALNTAGSAGGWLHLKNTSANAADLGPAGVTAGAGYALAASQVIDVLLAPGETLFAIRTGGTDATISVLRTGF
jgi:hypothetical protein